MREGGGNATSRSAVNDDTSHEREYCSRVSINGLDHMAMCMKREKDLTSIRTSEPPSVED